MILRPYDSSGKAIGVEERVAHTSIDAPVWGFKLWDEAARSWVVAHKGMTLAEAKATAEKCILLGLTGKDFQ